MTYSYRKWVSDYALYTWEWSDEFDENGRQKVIPTIAAKWWYERLASELKEELGVE